MYTESQPNCVYTQSWQKRNLNGQNRESEFSVQEYSAEGTGWQKYAPSEKW